VAEPRPACEPERLRAPERLRGPDWDREPDLSGARRERRLGVPARQRPRRRGGVGLFVLGAVIGGVAGGVAGGAATYVWMRADEVLSRVPAIRPVRQGPTLSTPEGAPAVSVAEREARAGSRPAAPSETAAVETALNAWLAATKRGDIDAQMQFYPPRVPVYYTWRDVPWSAVRDEKLKVFGAATTLEVETGPPTVDVAADGRTALTRFRKRYVIEGPVIRRRGEVVQELRWTRSPDGWRIVAERDAGVLAR
jgi:ketosteroid isomerase-like protein